MYLAIIILPLLGSIVSGFFGRKVGVSGAQLITCLSVFTTTALSILAFFEVGMNNAPVSIQLFRWIDSESLNVLWSFNFDSLTVSMLIPVLIVSSLVHLYSIGYMSHDPHNQRFFSYLSLFTFMMIILVTANNFLLMFVGWEGVGVCSYLLVSFWFTRIAANQSSLSAFLTNRVGDCFLTIGMFAIIWSFGNLDYATVFSTAPFVSDNIVTLVGICLLIGAMAKSSQVGLHIWLPMAMEGPTPVSALIHAATMVTAGVYLLMRSSPLIEYSNTVLVLCLWLGAITTIFSSLIGLFQQDIKKVIAYSTMSQLAREYNIYYSTIIFKHQTICVEVVLNTINSQITKARFYHKKWSNSFHFIDLNISNRFFNSLINKCWLLVLARSDKNSFIAKRLIEKWKVVAISKWVGISEAIRLIIIYFSLYLYICICLLIKVCTNNSFYLKYDISRNSLARKNCSLDITNNVCKIASKEFNQWLAGLIDGDGHFLLSKKGSARLYIVMDIRDKKALYDIMHRFGGSINTIANANALRYNLSNKKGLISLIHAVNGEIRNPTRLLQLHKFCVKYNIQLIYPKPLTFNNGWFSGFLDSDGSIYFNSVSGQVFISATQKNIYLLEPLINIYGGRVDPSNAKGSAFKYIIYRKTELFNIIDNYFVKYPLRTLKHNRMILIKEFFNVRLSKNNQDVLKLKNWVEFKDKWEKYM